MLSYRLRHVVQLQESTQTQDPVSGELIKTWRNIELSAGKPNIPAEVLTGAGREAAMAGARFAEVDVRVNLRWFPYKRLDLYQCRLIWDDEIFDIVDVQTDVTTCREWRLKCKAGINPEGA
ncbi:head-tail adaptor protein [Gimesia sp.]|uniref:head-tail adaptor protein n=1 Tax=Gimesia sp. TaxID=2024833 RepID=UPI003A939FE1